MKKTLILGCSFLNGAYTSYDTPIPGTSWVSSLDNSKFDAFSFSGHGIITWIEFINYLVEIDKIKEYDRVIVQHSTEPRIVAHNWNKVKDNTTVHIKDVFDLMLNIRKKQSNLKNIIDYNYMYRSEYSDFNGYSLGIFSIHRHEKYLEKFSESSKSAILEYFMDIDDLFRRGDTLNIVSDAFNAHLRLVIEKLGLSYIPLFWYGRTAGGNHATDEDFVVIEEATKVLGITEKEWYENTNKVGHNNLEQARKVNPIILEYLDLQGDTNE